MRDLSLALWALCAGLVVSCECLARFAKRPFATFRAFLRLLSGTTSRTVVLFVGWMWLGWHFFAR